MTGPDERHDRAHLRAFRALLRLLPASFRGAYGREMTEFFRERLRRARRERGRWGVARLWVRTAADVARTAAAEWWGGARRRMPGNTPGNVPGNTPGHMHTTEREAGMMSTLGQDLRHAARRLVRTPLFTLAAVAILALGIGVNTAAFSLVDAVLFRPPPFERPEEVVNVYQHGDDGDPSSTSFPAYRDMAAMSGVFAGVAATSPGYVRYTWDAAAGPRDVRVVYATSSYFPVLGLQPSRGRWFDPGHDQPGAGAYAVVSHRTWRAEMGADPSVVGRAIRLNGQPVTVVGVGPPDFNGTAGALTTDFWLSISSTVVGGPFRVANLDRREDHWYQVQARLAPGVSVARAQAALDGLARRLGETYPEVNRGRGITVFAHDEVRFHPDTDGSLRTMGTALLGIVGLVLLLACANLANLLLVRGLSRSSEMAVRKALGAGRLRLTRLFLFEAMLLSVVGGAVGLAVAAWAVGLVPHLPLPVPGGSTFDVALDGRVLTFSVGLVVLTGLLFGLLPGLRSARADVAGALREESRGASAGRTVSLLRGGLVAVQVAVSVILVVGAGLLSRSLANARAVDPGVDVDRIAVLGTSLTEGGVTAEEVPVVTEELLRRVEAIPGVEQAAITSRLPAEGGGTTTTVVEGYDPPSGTGAVELAWKVVSRDYFETMGIPLVEGRTFSEDDRPETPEVIVMNETAARRFWGGDAVGRRTRSQGSDTPWREVVGVVGDATVSSVREPPTPIMYFAAEQNPLGSLNVVARARGEPADLLPALRSVLGDVRASLSPTRLTTLEDHFGADLAGPRAAAGFMGAFSLLALLLAALGVYAVVSFSVVRRSREMGIRTALGAGGRRLVRMVVGESLGMVLLGIVAGLVLAGLAVPRMEGALFGVEGLDAVTFAGAALLLLAAAGAAAWLPARRAARLDPVEVLRAE